MIMWKNPLFSFILLFFSTIGYTQEIEIVTQEKIQGNVTVLTYSPNGQLIASANTGDNSIKVWDINSGKIIGKLVGHSQAITALCFTEESTGIVSVGNDKKIMHWNILNWELQDSTTTSSTIQTLTPTGKNEIVSGNEIGDVQLWSLNALNEPKFLFNLTNEITDLNYHNNLLATVTKNGQLAVYDLANSTMKTERKVSIIPFKSVTFIEDAARILTVSLSGKAQLFPINDLENESSFNVSNMPISAVAVNIAEQKLVVANATNTMKVFDFTGAELNEFKNESSEDASSKVSTLAISPDGSTFACSGKRPTVAGKFDFSVKIWDLNRGTIFKELVGKVNPIYSFDFHPTENKLITLGDEHTLTFWDFDVAEKYGAFVLQEPSRDVAGLVRPGSEGKTTGEKIRKARNFGNIVGDVMSGNLGGLSDVAKDKGKAVGAGLAKRAFKEKSIVKYSSKGSYLITKLKQDEIRLYDLADGKPNYLQAVYSYQLSINQLQTSPDEKYLAVIGSGDSAVSIIDLATKKILRKLYTPGPTDNLNLLYEANSLAFSPDGKYFAVCFNNSKTYVFETTYWQLVFENILPDNLGYVESPFVNFSKDGEVMVVKSMLGIKKYKASENFNLFLAEELSINGYSAAMDQPQDYAITIKDDYVYFEDLFTKKVQKSIRVRPEDITNIAINPAGKVGITFSSGQFKLIDPNTGKEEVLLVADGDNYIFKTDENYYKVSKEGRDLVTYRIGNAAYPFEQFDAIYNRPDLVLTAMGCKDEQLIELYHKAYLKRIAKLNIQPTAQVSLTAIPKTALLNTEKIPAVTVDKSLPVSFVCSDTKGLKSYNIWINNVPVYGKSGKAISGTRQEITANIQLVHGINKIQIACLNKTGFESLIQTFYVEKTGEKPVQNLYLVTIGTADYKDDRYDLNYPVKDGEDLRSLLATNREGIYGEIFSKKLYDAEVTVENIRNLSSFLKDAKPNDVVLVFIAGHGILDANFDYYFGTYGIDFTNPSSKGLAYAELENILEKTPANRKLLIMDTCHSGEVDKEEVFFAQEEEEEEAGDISFRAVGAAVKTDENNASPSRLSKELFNDLRKGTGATVISSAGGVEFAMESDEWKNGLFTYCLLSGLKNRTADLNNDGIIMLSEMQEYVVNKVTALSHGKQVPNSRIQNLELDFPIW
jgi:WD40 repeat protein